MSTGFDWLLPEEDQTKAVPEGFDLPGAGGDFVPGIAGYYELRRCLSFMTDPGVDITEPPFNFSPDLRQKYERSGKVRWYWNVINRTAAEMAQKEFGARFLQEKFCMIVKTSTVLGWENAEKGPATWGETVMDVVDIASPTSKYGKHFHYLLWPSFVQSLALSQGWFDTMLGFYESLKDTNPDLINDEFAEKMWGPADSRKFHEDTVLGQWRAQIWAALGESNVMAWQRGEDAKFATTSKLLAAALSPLYRETTSMWMRLVRVPDPNPTAHSDPDNVSSSGKHYRVPIVAEIYTSEEAARAAFVTEEEGAPSAQSNGAMPPVPAKWQKFGAQSLVEFVQDFVAEQKIDSTMPPAMLSKELKKREKQILASANVSVEEFEPWVKYVLTH